MGGDEPPKLGTAPPLLRHIASFDERISLHIHTLTTPLAPKLLLRLLEHLADFRFFFPVSLSLYFAAPSSSPLRSHLLLPLILCSLLDLIIIGLVKSLARRSRPSYATNHDYSAVVSVDNFSFPSGHSSRVSFIASIFSLSRSSIIGAIAGPNHPHLATLVHRWIGGDEVLAVNLLVAAVWLWTLTTIVSRVVLGRHYILDVFFGACFGVLEALLTLRFLEYRALI